MGTLSLLPMSLRVLRGPADESNSRRNRAPRLPTTPERVRANEEIKLVDDEHGAPASSWIDVEGGRRQGRAPPTYAAKAAARPQQILTQAHFRRRIRRGLLSALQLLACFVDVWNLCSGSMSISCPPTSMALHWHRAADPAARGRASFLIDFWPVALYKLRSFPP